MARRASRRRSNARHLEGDFGPAWREPFVRTYGIADIDESKLAFFRLLDELF
jgi:aminoglycoside phosphotransferase